MAIGLWDRERRIDVKIRIPDIEGNTNYIENKKSVVLIGANGDRTDGKDSVIP